jgi:heavy metal translocating P-type ATPase
MPGAPASCAYCGLPVSPGKWFAGNPAEPEHPGPLYCCYGCRFADEVSRSSDSGPGHEGHAVGMLTRLGLSLFFAMNVMVFAMALWTQDVYGSDAVSSPFPGLFRYLCLLFALPVLLLLGIPLLDEAWRNLRRGVLATDLLIVLGVTASYLYSAWSVWADSGHVYFEVGCMVLVLITAGRWLEAVGRSQASQALARLHRLLPENVRVLRDGAEASIPAAEVSRGDTVRVLPGERIPCDGRVLGQSSPSAVDERMLTGESEPLLKEAGDPVLGGSLNLDGDLLIEAAGGVGEGALARLIDRVRQAAQTRGRFQRQADRAAAWFVPLVALIALGALVYHGFREGPEPGLQAGLAVLLIACPCALGVATPLAVWTALGHAAEHQVLFRTGETLERLAGVRVVCLDKTGTLTTDTPEVAAFHACPEEREVVLHRARELAGSTAHAHAAAIRDFIDVHYPEMSRSPSPVGSRTLPGRGVVASLPAGETTILGSPRLAGEHQLRWAGPLGEDGRPMTVIGWGGAVRGVFVLREQLREGAAEAVAALLHQGLTVQVLTGDHSGRGAHVAKALGVPVREGLLPEEKAEAVCHLRKEKGPVAMVGDGLNDAPALVASDVGIALGCGADVSRESAGVCLLSDDLARVGWAIALARKAVRIIRQNLIWAFAYNLVGIGLAAWGKLTPMAMVLSSLIVVVNSRRLAGKKGGQPCPA